MASDESLNYLQFLKKPKIIIYTVKPNKANFRKALFVSYKGPLVIKVLRIYLSMQCSLLLGFDPLCFLIRKVFCISRVYRLTGTWNVVKMLCNSASYFLKV